MITKSAKVLNYKQKINEKKPIKTEHNTISDI